MRSGPITPNSSAGARAVCVAVLTLGLTGFAPQTMAAGKPSFFSAISVGTTLTISGTNLTTKTSPAVILNGATLTLQSASESNIVVTLPGSVPAGTLVATVILNKKPYPVDVTFSAPATITDGSITAAKLGADVGVWSVNGSNVFRASGNVGIGTNAPAATLEVEGSSNGVPTMIVGAPGGAAVKYVDGAGGSLWDVSYGTNAFAISRSGIDFPFIIDLSTGNTTINNNLGIGTTTPGAPLEVDGGNASNGVPTMIVAGANGAMTKYVDTNGGSLWDVYASTATYSISRSGIDFPFVIDKATGQVGIETGSPDAALTVNGTADKPGGGSWATFSDARLKKNIRPLTGALDQLLKLQAVTFEYKDPQSIHELPGVQVGMVAQQVEKVFPDWVDTAPNGMKRLSFHGFEALTVEALRELRSEKDARIAELEQQNAQLAQRLGKLESKLQQVSEQVQQSQSGPTTTANIHAHDGL